MKIGNKIIKGIYRYDKSLQFTLGDFVLSGTEIYICKPSNGKEFVSGEEPSADSDNFILYLADKVATIEDYNNFIKTGSSENRILSLGMVKTVLDGYMLGITGNGIITEATGSEALSELLASETNYATLMIARDHPEIKNHVIQKETREGNNKSVTPEETALIVRQYTYLNSNSRKVRVQELFDHIWGMVYTRTSVDNTTTPWELIVGGESSILQKANELISTYTSRIDELESLQVDLKQNFRFQAINTDVRGMSEVSISGSEINNKPLITCLIKTPSTSGINHASSITINLTDGNEKYYVSHSIYLTVSSLAAGGGYKLTLGSDMSEEKPVFSYIYYQKYYG